MRVPYIGITDFMNYDQVLRIEGALAALPQRRRLHVGVMMSYKTLHGLPTKWTNAFPPNADIAGIFQSPDAMNCLHYADYDAVDVADSLTRAIAHGGPGMNALQLDMVWPDPDAVASALCRSDKNIDLVLQVGKNAIEAAHHSPRIVVERIREYEGLPAYVLLDKSMGRGLGMDAEGLRPFARAIAEAFPYMGIVVAGGLGPYTVRLVEPLLAEFPNISIDAQGQLRESGNALDPIDWDRAETYITRAVALLP